MSGVWNRCSNLAQLKFLGKSLSLVYCMSMQNINCMSAGKMAFNYIKMLWKENDIKVVYNVCSYHFNGHFLVGLACTIALCSSCVHNLCFVLRQAKTFHIILQFGLSCHLMHSLAGNRVGFQSSKVAVISLTLLRTQCMNRWLFTL